MPYKRWNLILSGDWENGWEAAAVSRLVAEGGIEVSTNDSGFFHEAGGHRTAESALLELARRLLGRR